MSDVSEIIQEISIAKVGKEVRTPVSDVLDSCYSEVTNNKTNDPEVQKAIDVKITDGTLTRYQLADGEITNSKYAKKTIQKEKLGSDVSGGLTTDSSKLLYECLSEATFQDTANKNKLLSDLKTSLQLEDTTI